MSARVQQGPTADVLTARPRCIARVLRFTVGVNPRRAMCAAHRIASSRHNRQNIVLHLRIRAISTQEGCLDHDTLSATRGG